MNKEDIYHTLVAYHTLYNIPSLQQLQFTLPTGTEQKGTKVHPVQGALLFANGASLIEKLQNRCYFEPEELGPEVSISSPHSFMSALETYLPLDGAIIIDSKAETMRHAAMLVPPSQELRQHPGYFSSRLPLDFRTMGNTTPLVSRNFGTRTKIAMIVPMLEEGVEAFEIGQTVYSAGSGKILRFKRDGLSNEVYVTGDIRNPVLMERVYTNGPNGTRIEQQYQAPAKYNFSARAMQNWADLKYAP